MNILIWFWLLVLVLLVGLFVLIIIKANNLYHLARAKRKAVAESSEKYYEEKHFVLTKQKRKLIHFHRWTNWSELVGTPSLYAYQFKYCLDCNKIDSRKFTHLAHVRLEAWNHKPNEHQELHNK